MPGAAAELCELSEVEVAVGPQSFERGRAYARRGRVLKRAWRPDGLTLTGAVVGNGALYRTTAFFVEGDGGTLEFEDGECSCPMGYNCKHVAALVIDAAGGRPRPSPRPAWDAALRALIEAPPAQRAGSPLAVEVSLYRDGVAPRLIARPM